MHANRVAVLVLLIGSVSLPTPRAPANTEEVTLYRDAYGTPQVVAHSNRGVYFGYGYAVASDRLCQMEMLKRTTEGRVAEVLDADYLALDSLVRTGYDHPGVARQVEALSAGEREILQAYADGFNRRITDVLADRAALLPLEFSDHGFDPEPWTVYDMAMIFVGSIAHRYADFNSERDNPQLLQHLERRHGKAKAWRIFNASKWLLDQDSPTTVPETAGIPSTIAAPARPDYLDDLPPSKPVARVGLAEGGRFLGITDDPAMAQRQKHLYARSGFSASPGYTGASNYWAVRKLADADAALVNGPQFGFGVPSYVYGIGLHGGDFNTVGNTPLGLPALLFAHNDHIAWGSTAGISDQTDEFALTLHQHDPGRYRYANGWRKFQPWPETIAVRGASPVTVTAPRAVQGMVLDHQNEQGVAWVRARAWEGRELATLMAWTFLATDTTLDAARGRIAAMAANINTYTMDQRGNLAYTHSGHYPQRPEGRDPRLPAPGDGTRDWRGMRPYSDNPSTRNPAQDYIANWNNRPSRDWISSDLWTYTWSRADRARLLFDALDARRGGTVGAINAVNRDITFADVNVPYLFSAWDNQAQSPAVASALTRLHA